MTDKTMDWYENGGGGSADNRLREMERRIARLEALASDNAARGDARLVDDDLKARGLK